MKKFFLSAFFLCFSYGFLAQGQENQRKMKKLKDTTKYFQTPNQIMITATPEAEGYLFYERFFGNRQSLEGSLGYKSISFDPELYWLIPVGINPAHWYSGFNYALAYKYYLSYKKNPWYISFLGFYKNYSYPERTVYFEGDDDNWKIYSGKKRVWGGKLLFGKKFMIESGEKASFYGDLYMGLGFRSKMYLDRRLGYHNFVSQQTYYYPEPVIVETNDSMPSIHLGFKLGVGF